MRQWVGDNVIHHVEEEFTGYGTQSKLDNLYANKQQSTMYILSSYYLTQNTKRESLLSTFE